MSSRFRAVVLGLGPAGRIAAHRAAARGWDVLALDPAGGSMPSTVGAWVHQLPGWLPAEAVASRFHPSVVTSSGRARVLSDEYAILDTGVLASLNGFDVRRERGFCGARAVHMRWGGREGARSGLRGVIDGARDALVRVRAMVTPDPGEGPSVVVDSDGAGGDFAGWTDPDVVVDAVGADSGAVLVARQLAFGQVFRESDLPEGLRVPVLMDFTVPGPAGSGDEWAAEGYPATFSYRLPLGDGTWLIEETILAARTSADPGDPGRTRLHSHLRDAQARRLDGLGVDPTLAIGEETVDFSMGPRRLPDNRPRTPLHGRLRMVPVPGSRTSRLDLGFLARPFGGSAVPGHAHFGAGGGWMHPATGYSVGAVLSDVDRFLDRLGARGDASPAGGRPLAWLRRRGLHVLLAFDATQTREFFDSFFTLPDSAIREYLTGTSAPETMSVMLRLVLPLARRNPATLVKLLATFADGKPTGRR